MLFRIDLGDAMKALILAGGKGTRLKPLTNTINKQLLPVANRPILHYAIDEVLEAGITDIGIIISPETTDSIKESVGDGSEWNATITYIRQPEPLGLAHAVKTAEDFLGNSSFLMFLGDNLIGRGIKNIVEHFGSQSPDALIMLKEVTNPHLFGIAELDVKGRVVRLVEKPKEPKTNLALVGIYLFSPAVHEAIAHIKPSLRGELEITDAIQGMIEQGRKVLSHRLEGWWLHMSKKDDLLEANRVVLDDLLKRNVEGQVDSNSKIAGRVEIKKGAKIINSTIQGPTSIAEDCQIENSFIGPFTSIGAGTVIRDSSLEHSVVLENCRILKIERLADSIIGRDTDVTKQEQNFKAITIFVGDDAKIEL